MVKKRDASTDLLRRLHGYMQQHNVDFIGGDFNMSAFSSVGDVFSDPEFSAPGNSFLWGLGALEEANRECTGFLILPKRPYEWRANSHGCYKQVQQCRFGIWTPRLLGSPSSSTFAPPTCLVQTVSRAVNEPNKEGLNAKPPGLSDGRGDVDERDVVDQDHVSAYLPTPSTVTSESLAQPLFPTALTFGHFASCLSVSVSVSVSVSGSSLCLC